MLFNPKEIDISKYFKIGTAQELEELLFYEWRKKTSKKLVDKGQLLKFIWEKRQNNRPLKVKEFLKILQLHTI